MVLIRLPVWLLDQFQCLVDLPVFCKHEIRKIISPGLPTPHPMSATSGGLLLASVTHINLKSNIFRRLKGNPSCALGMAVRKSSLSTYLRRWQMNIPVTAAPRVHEALVYPITSARLGRSSSIFPCHRNFSGKLTWPTCECHTRANVTKSLCRNF